MTDQQHTPGARVSLQMTIDSLDGTTSATTDVAVENVQLRRIVDSIARRLQDGYSELANRKADEARQLVADGKIQEAANTLLQVGSSIRRLSLSQVALLSELSQHANVDPPSRLQLMLAVTAVYEANAENVRAREAAEKARLLATDQGRNEIAAAALLTIANTYAREEQDQLARAKIAEVIKLARREGLTDTLAWAYHNLGSLLWQTGKRGEAFLQWDREQEVRQGQDLLRRARSMAFLADKYEQFDPVEAASLFRQLVDLLENDSDAINLALRAESAYRLAVFRLGKGEWAAVIKYADISIASYTPLANQEHRLAWGHQLLALAYEGQKK